VSDLVRTLGSSNLPLANQGRRQKKEFGRGGQRKKHRNAHVAIVSPVAITLERLRNHS